jgi:hypothetical protein
MRNVGAPTFLRKQDTGFPHKARGRAELYYLSHARAYRNDGVRAPVKNLVLAARIEEGFLTPQTPFGMTCDVTRRQLPG